jgi:thioredoxin 1
MPRIARLIYVSRMKEMIPRRNMSKLGYVWMTLQGVGMIPPRGGVLKRCALLSSVAAMCLISNGIAIAQAQSVPAGASPHKSTGEKTAGKGAKATAKPAATDKAPGGKPKVVDLGAVWCVPCKKFAPIFEKAKTTYGEKVDFQSLDFDKPDGQAFVHKYDITAVPAIVIFDGAGKILYKHTGELDEATFDAQVAKVAH